MWYDRIYDEFFYVKKITKKFIWALFIFLYEIFYESLSFSFWKKKNLKKFFLKENNFENKNFIKE